MRRSSTKIVKLDGHPHCSGCGTLYRAGRRRSKRMRVAGRGTPFSLTKLAPKVNDLTPLPRERSGKIPIISVFLNRQTFRNRERCKTHSENAVLCRGLGVQDDPTRQPLAAQRLSQGRPPEIASHTARMPREWGLPTDNTLGQESNINAERSPDNPTRLEAAGRQPPRPSLQFADGSSGKSRIPNAPRKTSSPICWQTFSQRSSCPSKTRLLFASATNQAPSSNSRSS